MMDVATVPFRNNTRGSPRLGILGVVKRKVHYVLMMIIVAYALTSTILINKHTKEHDNRQEESSRPSSSSSSKRNSLYKKKELLRLVDSTQSAREVTTATGASASATGVPRLPLIPKPEKANLPSFKEVKTWMSTDGNQTAGQFMLDFAVLGFAKCGTSTMMFWLGNQPEIFVPPYEITALNSKPSWEVIKEMYKGEEEEKNGETSVANNTQSVRLHGFKSPNDIMDTRPVRIMRDYFPKTKIIVGLRHPVLMIESFYNHRIQNGLKMPPMEELPYGNTGHSHLVTLGRAAYSDSLIHLGKTNFSTIEERSMIHYTKRNDMKKNNIFAFPKSPNPVYIYDTAQLNDKNTTRIQQILVDLQNFLGLSKPLDKPLHFSPGKKQVDEKQLLIDAKKAHICEDRYAELRKSLISIGTASQKWILDYFLKSPDVYVSNPQHFREILEGYQRDPCLEKKEDSKTAKTT